MVSGLVVNIPMLWEENEAHTLAKMKFFSWASINKHNENKIAPNNTIDFLIIPSNLGFRQVSDAIHARNGERVSEKRIYLTASMIH